MKPYNKRKHRRYSNELPFVDLGTTGDYSDVSTHQTYNANGTPLGQDTSGSGYFDWSGFFNNLVNNTSSVLQSIYGRNNITQAQMTQQMLEQERKTTTILWVVIGLVLALGVFLVIRKTK